jgi:EAL domain-containing protein (putative c-di-GMP-specific phosphodiesterase class I)
LIYELNLITDFNLKVLDKLVEYLPILKKAGKKVFVNVSSIDLKKLNFRQKLIETIITFQNEGLDLGIELTEQAVFEDYEFLEFLNQGLGIKFAIDDFGTGYSSLKMVIDLFSKGLISAIKLDCTLVKSYFESEGARALITSIVEFTKMFNLETIAECVETKEHVDTLRKLGVTHGQGWYFYKALPVWELPEVAKKRVKL